MVEPLGRRPSTAEASSLADAKAILGYATERRCILRSLKVALVVGTVLAVINHFDALLTGTVTPMAAIQIGITYTVPYLVATFGSAMQERAMKREATNG